MRLIGLAFQLGGLFERGQADLEPFFGFHPWLYLLLVPAVAMRLWADERKTGTVELLLTLPISIGQAVVGKFLAAWPTDDQVGLMEVLAKRGTRLGGFSGQYFLRFLGWDA